ncbi:MAG TPA: His/Gly/Thr/Pro-type tRNA ligase C-terminal domain-containing protein, partial [Chitinophagaceae bacterium]|nr:His/Gly/Thr/Pro-type tRNA ligase C-terminal domain-containing protein [Chitinophagaceae bacterium]
KIGLEKVKLELTQRGLDNKQVAIIEKYLLIAKYSGDNETVLDELKKLFGDNAGGNEGLKDLQFVLDNTSQLAFTSKILVDPTLARGLNYYTGTIFEVKAADVKMGSIGGGGRYDDLTGLFGVPGIPGVGISFGVDRIYDVMEELKLFPEEVHTGTQVLFFNLGEKESQTAFSLMQQLRNINIRCELYHEPVKFDKQFKYAERKNIPYAVIIGEKELADKSCVIKNLRSGDQQTIAVGRLAGFSFT